MPMSNLANKEIFLSEIHPLATSFVQHISQYDVADEYAKFLAEKKIISAQQFKNISSAIESTKNTLAQNQIQVSAEKLRTSMPTDNASIQKAELQAMDVSELRNPALYANIEQQLISKIPDINAVLQEELPGLSIDLDALKPLLSDPKNQTNIKKAENIIRKALPNIPEASEDLEVFDREISRIVHSLLPQHGELERIFNSPEMKEAGIALDSEKHFSPALINEFSSRTPKIIEKTTKDFRTNLIDEIKEARNPLQKLLDRTQANYAAQETMSSRFTICAVSAVAMGAIIHGAREVYRGAFADEDKLAVQEYNLSPQVHIKQMLCGAGEMGIGAVALLKSMTGKFTGIGRW